jgi:hypothetical protein
VHVGGTVGRRDRTYITLSLGASLGTSLFVSLLSDIAVVSKPLQGDSEQLSSLLFSGDRVFHDGRAGGIGDELVWGSTESEVADVGGEGLDMVVDVGGVWRARVCLWVSTVKTSRMR